MSYVGRIAFAAVALAAAYLLTRAVRARRSPLRLVCAWCRAELSPGREPVTHGICPPCANHMREGEVRVEVPARRVPTGGES